MTSPSGRAPRAASLLGDDYQHLLAWSEAVHAVRPASDATKFRVEAVDAGSYDDISVLSASGRHAHTQAKFAVDPTDGFSLDWLVQPTGSGNRRLSLAQRALATHRQLATGGRPRLRLVTNRHLAPSDGWMESFRSAEENTLGHAARRLLEGPTENETAHAALVRLQQHLSCDRAELCRLLDVWELQWGSGLQNEVRVAKARMAAVGLRDDDEALRAGRDLMRQLVKDGVRSLTQSDLSAAVDDLGIRLRAPARVLAVSVLGLDPLHGDADEHVDLTRLFAGRTGDRARGLTDGTWDDQAAPALEEAVERLRPAHSGPVLVSGLMRLPVWFRLGSLMKHVEDWTLLTQLGERTWSSRDTPAAGPYLSADESAGGAAGRRLVVGLSVTADVREDVRAYQAGHPEADGDALWLTVPQPSSTAVPTQQAAAAIVDETRKAITRRLSTGRYDSVHLFMSAPRFISLFLGHRWHRLVPVVVYETLGAGRGYQAAFTVD